MAELTEEEAQFQLQTEVDVGSPFAGLGLPTGFIVNYSVPTEIPAVSANATVVTPSFDGTAGANAFGGPGVGLSLPEVPVVQGGFTFGVPPSDFAAGQSTTVTVGLGVVGVTPDGKGQFVGLSTPNIGFSSSLGIPIGDAAKSIAQNILEGGQQNSSSVISDPVLIAMLPGEVPFMQSVIAPATFPFGIGDGVLQVAQQIADGVSPVSLGNQTGVGQVPGGQIGDGNGIGDGVLQTAQQVADNTAPLSDFNSQPTQIFDQNNSDTSGATTELGNISALVDGTTGVGTLLQGAQGVVSGTTPLTDQVGDHGETFGNDTGDGTLQNLQNASSSVLNANAQDLAEAGLPAVTSSAGDGALGAAAGAAAGPGQTTPVGAIDQQVPNAGNFDPAANNSFVDSVQQAADSIDSVNQSVADNLLGDNVGSNNGNFGSGGFGSGGFGSGGFGSGGFGSGGGFSGFAISGGGFVGGSGTAAPVVLDVAGLVHQADHGIKITQLSSSNTFFDMTGSGRQNLTAWAGAGNGVLFFDATGQGQLTQEKQIEFTAWDPGAKSDMQALEDVFDTNHDGSLDASDADFNDFFVMVTNADGTKTAYSLAQLGITSINLNANAANINLPDGSSINGETTYTTSTGTTGTAATVTFAFDANGQVIQTTTTVNADGSTTVANAALNADGSVAYTRILNTSANGLNKTLTDLNNGGVVTTIQTDDTVENADGSATETLTNYAGGTIQANGELTANGTTGSDRLNSTATTTSADGRVVTILRDQLGGGFTTQKEVDTSNADGSTSIVISNLNPDGSASSITTTALSADGLTRTVTNLVDGIAADSATSVDATVVNGTTRNETATNSLGTTVTSKSTTVTLTDGNSVTRTTNSDLTDGTTLNRTYITQTVTNASGSTITQTDSSANGTLLDETVTTNTPQSNGGLVTAVTTSELDGLGHFIEVGSQTTTISNAGATATKTVINDSANGMLRSESITTSAVGSAARSVTTYGNGDGKVTQSQTVTVSGGTTTDTVENLNADGSLVSETVAVTTNGGLSKTTSVDSTGSGTAGAPVFDHITTDVTTVSGGSSTETVTQYGASTSNVIGRTQTVKSANGLTTTVSNAFTATSLSNNTWDQITTDQTVVNSDGSLTETITVTDGSNHVLETTQKSTSANREVVTSTTTLGTTNLVETVEKVTTESNGTVQDQVIRFDQQGDVINATVTTTSADGLTKTIQSDIQGQTAAAYLASGLAFDLTTTGTTVINADGSRYETTNVNSQNGTLLSTSSAATSANGLTLTSAQNPFATIEPASNSTDATTLNADGSSTTTVSVGHFSVFERTTTTTSADGLSTTVLHNFNGDDTTHQATTDVVTINADGSRTETVTDYTGGTNGVVRDVTTTTSGIIVPGAGLETAITYQTNGSVPFYQTETIAPSANGTVTDTTQTFAKEGGPLLRQTIVTTSANGLIKTVGTAVNGDTSTDFSTTDATVLNADGSKTRTVSTSNKAGLISETVTTVSANGLSKTTQIDANGAFNGANPVFNSVTTDNTVLNSDGSRTETITTSAANGATPILQTVTTTSADQQTITINRSLDETGSIATADQSEVVQTQADGSVKDTISSFDAGHNPLSTVVKTTSGNGLSASTVFKNASGTTLDSQSDTTVYDPNGDGGTTETFLDTDAAVGFTTSLTKKTSGNASSTTATLNLAGALAGAANGFGAVAADNVSIDGTGARNETIVDTINGASTSADTTTILISANQLGTEVSTALGSADPYITQQTTIALDGSKSEVTTYFDPANLLVTEEQTTIDTSADGRTITTTEMSANDQVNQSFDGVTPTFGGSGSNTETNTLVENADGTTRDTRTGSGSFGAPAYTQTVNSVTNADSSITTTTLNYDANGLLAGQIISDISPNGLVKSYAYDTTGGESSTNLNAAAADIASGAALPALLGTDIIESDATTLNGDGSKTRVVKTAFGNSLANQRSLNTTITSANGLVTTTFVDNDGTGVYQEVGTITTQSDGSQTRVYNFYDNRSSTTQQINGMTVGGTLLGTNTYTVSANGLITQLSTSTGIMDTTATFANANGSYEFSRSVTSGSKAASAGDTNGSSSHFIDANGIDTWTWNNGAGSSGTIQIDLATEKQDIAIADEIYQTLFGRPMDDAETQYLAQFITNGVLDREALAFSLVNTTEYFNNFELKGFNGDFTGWNTLTALENALGRLPTAEEMATFGNLTSSTEFSSTTASAQAFVPAAVAIAQYATDQGDSTNLTVIDPNQNLVAPPVQWENAALTQKITASGTYPFNNFLVLPQGVTATINGNSNIVVAEANQSPSNTITVNGFNNAIEAVDPATITSSNSSIMVDDSNVVTVSGNYDQIAQAGPSELTLASGSTGDTIAINAAPPNPASSQPPYTNSYAITNASNATITFAAGAGTSAAPEQVFGNSDSIREGANADITVSGSTDALLITGSGAVASISGAAVILGAGVSASVSGNNDAITLAANSTVSVVGSSDTVTVADTAANVSVNIGTLNSEGNVSAIRLTDTGTPTLTLSVAQVLNDTTALGEVSNSNYAIAIVDTAAKVSANIAALNANSHISSITLTDGGTPTLSLTAAQVADDTTALGKISNANYGIAVTDTAADVAADLAALTANPNISSITLTDSGTPTLALTAAQVVADAAVLGKIGNASYAITLTDSGTPTLSLTAAQVTADAAVLSKISNATFAITVTDTAANVTANIVALSANSHISTITLTDTGTVTFALSVAQALGDAVVFSKITNSGLTITITDTAANVSANIAALNAEASVSSITLTDIGTPLLALNVAQMLGDTVALGKISNAAYSIAIGDTTANVLANIAALNANQNISSIALTDTGTLTLALTAAQVAADGAALRKISNASYAITVTDTAADVVANLAALTANPNISSIALTDAGTPTLSLTATQLVADAAALGKISNANYAITLTDTGTPTLQMTAAQVVTDALVLSRISNATYAIAVTDTAANVSANIAVLNANAKITSISLSDAGTPTLTFSAAQALGNTVALGKINNASYAISIVDTAANVSTNVAALNANGHLSSITLTDTGTPTVTLTVAQIAADAGKITNSAYAIAVTDTAANVSANIASLVANSRVSSITLTDSGTPTLTLTSAQLAADLVTLAKITNAAFNIAVSDTGATLTAQTSTITSGANAGDTSIAVYNADGTLAFSALNDQTRTFSESYIENYNHGVPAGQNGIFTAGPNVGDSFTATLYPSGKAASITDNDTANHYAWSTQTLYYDFNGGLRVLTQLQRNGNLAVNVYDGSGNALNSGLQLAAPTSNSGLLTTTGEQYTIYYNGSVANSETITYTSGVNNGDTGLEIFNPSGGLVLQSFNDVNGARGNSYTNYYNSSGAIVWQFSTYDSGTLAGDTSAVTFNANQTFATSTFNDLDGKNGASYTSYYNSSGLLLSQSGTFDSGIAAGNTYTETFNANGSAATYAYNDLNGKNGFSYTNSYNGSGLLLSQSGTYDSGTLNGDTYTYTYNADGSVASYTIKLSVSQAFADATVLSQINPAYNIAISDTAANVSANIAALNSNGHLSSITLTDAGTPTLALTAAQVAADATALGKISNAAYGIAVTDTAANVVADLAALNAVGHLSSITLTDTGTPTFALTAAQVTADATALGKISNANYTITVADTAANVAANIAALNANSHISSITLTDAGTPTLVLTAAQAVADSSALAKLTNSNYSIVISDTAANVLADIVALNSLTHLASINLTDVGTPTLTFTVLQVLADAATLGKISNSSYNISISDTAANVSANVTALNAMGHLSSITLTDTGTPTVTLTAAQVVADADKITNSAYNIAVVDTAANVSANVTALNATGHLSSITLTDTGTPTVTLTAAQVVADAGKITNSAYNIAVVDTAADVVANIASLNANSHLTSITLTDSGTPTLTLTAAQAVADSVALAKVTNSNYSIVISDTAANVAANIAVLNSLAHLTSINLTDAGTPTLALKAAQALCDTGALGKIANANYAVAVSDNAANVAFNIDGLNADSRLASITLTDAGTPVLSLTAAQVSTDTAAIGKINNSSYTLATLIPADGTTALTQEGSNYFLNNANGSPGPILQYQGAPVTANSGSFVNWAVIGAVQVPNGNYYVAWKDATSGQYEVWITDSNGNYLSDPVPAVAANSTALEAFEPIFHQDLNGDGVVDLVATVIQTDGTTALTQVGSSYFLNNVNGSAGPILQYQGAPIVANSTFSGWVPIGAVQIPGGDYYVAWKNAAAAEFTAWMVDGNGNYLSNIVGSVSGNSAALEALEPIFQQDLNGDGVIDVAATVIQTDGTTALTQVGSNYVLNNVNGSTGPILQYQGSPIVANSTFSGWVPIGAVQIPGGDYYVAWKNAAAAEFTAWMVDGNGNYLSNILPSVSGNSAALEALEPIFHQDLNGDGVMGLNNVPTTVIESSGSTSLVEIGNNYFLFAGGGGPELEYNGAAVVQGQFTNWALIGAEATATGYEVAFKDAVDNLYTIWSVDSGGHYLSTLLGDVSPTTPALEALEPSFHQDLNGDGVTGINLPTTVIQTDGTIALTQVGSNYFLNNVNGSVGPALQYQGSIVVANTGAVSGWVPIGAVQISSGDYYVAWKDVASGQYTVWLADSNGNYLSEPAPPGPANSAALEAFEPIFRQDLNGDGLYGTAATVLEVASGTTMSVGQLAQSATIDAGASLELTGADSNTISFKTASGTLIIDNAASFSGEVVGLAGNGTLANSNAIDLRNVAFSSATESYSGNAAGGVLTVGDGQGDLAHIMLGGNYTSSTFNLISDGKGGTLVVDPPLARTSGGLSNNCDTRLDNQIAQIVQAMATYSTGQSASNPMIAQPPIDANLHSGIGAALHA